MLRNHIKIALRYLWRQKGYSLINVAGLAVGIAVCALIFLWVRDELSYDRFHEKADRIYRVLWDARYGDNEWRLARTPVPLADALREQFPDVERVVRFTTAALTLRLGEDWANEQSVLRTEEAFFHIFTVPFISGDPRTALNHPNAVVLTEEAARRYFPDEDPVGSTLETNDGTVLQVTGVVERFPSQSHLHFDFLVPLDATKLPEWQRTSWGSPPVYTYLAISEGADALEVEARLQDFVRRTVVPEGPFAEGENHYSLPLEHLTDIHLLSRAERDLSPGGNSVYVYLFSIIGIFILILACINFINLATARAAGRAKEVGVRKVLGSPRVQLIRQFLVETFVYVIGAMVLAMILIGLVLPSFNQFSGKEFEMGHFGSPFPLLLLAGITVFVTLAAGMYPAFFLSAFRPVHALKGAHLLNMRRDGLRNGLVVVQFCISVMLIAGTLVVRNQLQYVQSKQLGFEKEHVLVIENAGNLGNQYGVFRDRLEAQPAVLRTSGTQSLPGHLFDSTIFEPEQPANYEQSSVNYAWVDEAYVEVLDLEFVAGRNFSPSRSSDSSSFLINEEASRALGWTDPIGRTLTMGNGIRGPVIGVVKDFHYESLHTKIEPIFFPFVRWTPSYLAVRLQPGDVSHGLESVKQIWDEFVPQRPFSYSFLDQDYEKLYDSERQVARVFGVFAMLALFIACVGLAGLTSYSVVQRTKEIGIRKVVGASVYSIVALLSRDFVKLVCLSLLVATPLAYYLMQQWLEDFAYRIEIGPGVFLLAGAAALLIAMLTVTYQSVKAALTDPVKSLRYE